LLDERMRNACCYPMATETMKKQVRSKLQQLR